MRVVRRVAVDVRSCHTPKLCITSMEPTFERVDGSCSMPRYNSGWELSSPWYSVCKVGDLRAPFPILQLGFDRVR
jgi:hypothetical protein